MTVLTATVTCELPEKSVGPVGELKLLKRRISGATVLQFGSLLLGNIWVGINQPERAGTFSIRSPRRTKDKKIPGRSWRSNLGFLLQRKAVAA
jgi:hypothetical protein